MLVEEAPIRFRFRIDALCQSIDAELLTAALDGRRFPPCDDEDPSSLPSPKVQCESIATENDFVSGSSPA